MVQVNILEQLLRLFEIFKSNPYVIVLSIITGIVLIILLLANKFSNLKVTKFVWIGVYSLLFGIMIFLYHNEILNLIDYLIENIFLFLFFPNLAVYVLVLIIINTIIIKSTFSRIVSDLIKNINTIFFVLFNIIFYLIIYNIIDNKINVYEQLSIYTNNDLLILIELSMNLFLIWLALLLIIKISSIVILYISNKKLVNNKLILENTKEDLYDIPFTEIKPINTTNLIMLEEESVKSYNVFNDYLDIVPVKKKTFNFNDFEIKDVDNNQEKNMVVNNIEQLEIDDDIFIENNNIISNMDNIFKNENNYLTNILNDIELLKNNEDNSKQIRKIYDDIRINQKDLTLNDYNYLINMLLEIKNNKRLD